MEKIKCVLHGSFRKHYEEIKKIAHYFQSNGIEILAPKIGKKTGETEGFVHLEGDVKGDPKIVELDYISKMKELGTNGFDYFVNPEGTLGVSGSYELGISQSMGNNIFFLKELTDHPAALHSSYIKNPEEIVSSLKQGKLPLGILEKKNPKIP